MPDRSRCQGRPRARPVRRGVLAGRDARFDSLLQGFLDAGASPLRGQDRSDRTGDAGRRNSTDSSGPGNKRRLTNERAERPVSNPRTPDVE
jgi:hypothetical protein